MRQVYSQETIDALRELLAQTEGPEHDALAAFLADPDALSKRDATSEQVKAAAVNFFKHKPSQYCDFIACDESGRPKSF